MVETNIVTTIVIPSYYHCCMNNVPLYDALKKMRELTNQSIPFSFSYVSCDTTRQHSNGKKEVAKALLRTGLPTDMGIKSESLIGYVDLDTNKQGWFYLPLLMSFNQYGIE